MIQDSEVLSANYNSHFPVSGRMPAEVTEQNRSPV
jgi:hypothetical protein